MSRSSWKLDFINNCLLRKVCFLKEKRSSFSLRTWSRSSTVCSDFVGLRLRVHNGRDFYPVQISEGMLGHKLGEFVPTRVKYEFKKKKKKKK